MPHIVFNAGDNRNIKRMKVHIEVEFSQEYFHTPQARAKLDEIEQKFLSVIEEYFNSECIWDERMSNHEYHVSNY